MRPSRRHPTPASTRSPARGSRKPWRAPRWSSTGPERLRLDELIRRGLRARNDRRDVIADPRARYFGAELSERTLVPGDDARLGETRLEDWLRQPASAQRPLIPRTRDRTRHSPGRDHAHAGGKVTT